MNLLHTYGLYLLRLVPIQKIITFKNELILYVPYSMVDKIVFFLNKHTHSQYKILADICGVDYLNQKIRFEVIYNLLSIRFNSRITLKVKVDEISSVPSVCSIYKSASWWEREVWDLFGIHFSNHPDLRRILTDYGFEGHPLRKDFPLTGFLETRYNDRVKRVVYEPLELSQDYRIFNFQNPWGKF